MARKNSFLSSSEVYGEPLSNQLTKSYNTGKNCICYYKISGEELCKAYAQKYQYLMLF